MPIFRYHCPKCDETVELLVPRFDSEAECPKCGSPELEKLPSVFAAVTQTGPAGCPSRRDCPSAGSRQCGCGCGCHGGH